MIQNFKLLTNLLFIFKRFFSNSGQKYTIIDGCIPSELQIMWKIRELIHQDKVIKNNKDKDTHLNITRNNNSASLLNFRLRKDRGHISQDRDEENTTVRNNEKAMIKKKQLGRDNFQECMKNYTK